MQATQRHQRPARLIQAIDIETVRRHRPDSGAHQAGRIAMPAHPVDPMRHAGDPDGIGDQRDDRLHGGVERGDGGFVDRHARALRNRHGTDLRFRHLAVGCHPAKPAEVRAVLDA